MRLHGFAQLEFAYAGTDIRIVGPRGDMTFHQLQIFAIDPDIAKQRSIILGNSKTFSGMGFSSAGGFEFLDNKSVPPLQDDGAVRNPKCVKIETGSDLEKFFKLNVSDVCVVSTFRDPTQAAAVEDPGSEF